MKSDFLKRIRTLSSAIARTRKLLMLCAAKASNMPGALSAVIGRFRVNDKNRPKQYSFKQKRDDRKANLLLSSLFFAAQQSSIVLWCSRAVYGLHHRGTAYSISRTAVCRTGKQCQVPCRTRRDHFFNLLRPQSFHL